MQQSTGRSKRFLPRNSLKKPLDEPPSGVSEQSAFPQSESVTQLVDLIGSGLLHNILFVSVFQNPQTDTYSLRNANFKYLDGLTTRPRVLTHPNLFWCSASLLGFFFTLIITHSEVPGGDLFIFQMLASYHRNTHSCFHR